MFLSSPSITFPLFSVHPPSLDQPLPPQAFFHPSPTFAILVLLPARFSVSKAQHRNASRLIPSLFPSTNLLLLPASPPALLLSVCIHHMVRSASSHALSLLSNTSPTTLTLSTGHTKVPALVLPLLRLLSTFPPLPVGLSAKKLSSFLLTDPPLRYLLLPPPASPVFNHLVLPLLLKLSSSPTVLVLPYLTTAVCVGADGGGWAKHVEILEEEISRMVREEGREREGEGLLWIECV